MIPDEGLLFSIEELQSLKAFESEALLLPIEERQRLKASISNRRASESEWLLFPIADL